MLLDLAKRVKKGAALLDKKVPGWRKTMRRHDDTFNIGSGKCCVLGTLEHARALRKLGASKTEVKERLKLLAGEPSTAYYIGATRLGIDGEDYGFEPPLSEEETDWNANEEAWAFLQDLWKAEYQK